MISSILPKLSLTITTTIVTIIITIIITVTNPTSATSPIYPPYCSTPTQMSHRSIPPLSSTSPLSALTLLHVTAVIRHGARTPSGAHRCWEGYDNYRDPWNCNLTDIVETTIDQDDTEEADEEEEGGLQFVKKYDAHFGNHFGKSIHNVLGGTCQRQQLLTEGYRQQITNGVMLRNAYVRDASASLNVDVPSNLLLFDFDVDKDGNYEEGCAYGPGKLYFRADDFQRTVASGQVLLRSLFQPLIARHRGEGKTPIVIPVHTNDKETDSMAPNHAVCPRLEELESEAINSREYRGLFLDSKEATRLLELSKEKLGNTYMMDVPDSAVDCLMTTICDDRPLPPVLDDYDKTNATPLPDADKRYGPNRFHRMVDLAYRKKMFAFNYKNAAYARLVSVPIWSEILSASSAAEEEEPADGDEGGDRPRFSLFSGHDTTISPLLAGLDLDMDTSALWPPYASVLAIEKYRVDPDASVREDGVGVAFPSGVAFRMVYNGRVITNLLRDCDEELCDSGVLRSLVLSDYADMDQWERDCRRQEGGPTEVVEERKEVRGMPYTLVLISCVICMLIGATIMYVRMEKYKRKYETIAMELGPDYDGGVGGTAGSGRAYNDVSCSGAVMS